MLVVELLSYVFKKEYIIARANSFFLVLAIISSGKPGLTSLLVLIRIYKVKFVLNR